MFRDVQNSPPFHPGGCFVALLYALLTPFFHLTSARRKDVS